jgi:hypothetical protein
VHAGAYKVGNVDQVCAPGREDARVDTENIFKTLTLSTLECDTGRGYKHTYISDVSSPLARPTGDSRAETGEGAEAGAVGARVDARRGARPRPTAHAENGRPQILYAADFIYGINHRI